MDADGVTLRATTAHGLYDATRTLKQLLGPWSGSATVVSRSWTVPALSLKDSPPVLLPGPHAGPRPVLHHRARGAGHH